MSAFYRTGFRVSNATFNAIVMRYSDKHGHVKFNDFVAAYIKLKTLFGKLLLLLLYKFCNAPLLASLFDQLLVKYILAYKR